MPPQNQGGQPPKPPPKAARENEEFGVIVKAKELVKHTLIVTNNVNKFPKKYRFSLVNRMQDKALAIYENVLEANELNLSDANERRERLSQQARALTFCKELLFFIELCRELNLIDFNACEFWAKMVIEVKAMTAAWRKRDKSR